MSVSNLKGEEWVGSKGNKHCWAGRTCWGGGNDGCWGLAADSPQCRSHAIEYIIVADAMHRIAYEAGALGSLGRGTGIVCQCW